MHKIMWHSYNRVYLHAHTSSQNNGLLSLKKPQTASARGKPEVKLRKLKVIGPELAGI